MKTILLALTAFLLASSGIAQPHGRRHVHEYEKRNENRVVVYTTIVSTVHAAVPTVIAPEANAKATIPAQVSTPAKSVTGDTSFRGKDAAGSGYGFSYAPFKADGSCKNAEEVKKDFAKIGKDYSLVRIYGTGCNQVETVLAAAKQHNLKIFAGIFDIAQLHVECKLLINAAKNDWERFNHVSVGNELVNFAPEDQKAAKAAEVVSAIRQAKILLGAAGFKGTVSTVDTLVAARAHPSICEASDICTVNCHPYFDGNVKAAEAGKFVEEQVATLAKVIPNDQNIIVTETGWPWKGGNNGLAVASLANQALALSSIKTTYQANKSAVILFNIYNDHWKVNTAVQLGAEQFWGFDGLDAPSG